MPVLREQVRLHFPSSFPESGQAPFCFGSCRSWSASRCGSCRWSSGPVLPCSGISLHVAHVPDYLRHLP